MKTLILDGSRAHTPRELKIGNGMQDKLKREPPMYTVWHK